VGSGRPKPTHSYLPSLRAGMWFEKFGYNRSS